ncbi:unnamed protein product, partial [Prorocentrum cordatum]
EDAGLRKEEARSREGSRAREAYVKRATALKDDPRYKHVDGGPDDVFFAAAAAGCLKLDDGDYTFEVCLFDKATSTSFSPTSTSLTHVLSV